MVDPISVQILVDTQRAQAELARLSSQTENFERKLKSLEAQNQKLKSTLEQKVDFFAQKLGLGQITSEANAANVAFGTMGLLVGGIVAGAALLAAGLGLAVQRAEDINKSLRPIKFLAGADTAADLEFIRAEAQRTGVAFIDLTDTYKTYLLSAKAVGYSAAEINKNFKQLVESSQIYGLTSENLKFAILGETQALNKGKLSLQELHQIQNAGIPILSLLEKRFNLTGKELNAMLEKGVDAAQAMRGLNEQMAADTASGQTEAFNTLTASQGRLKTALDDVALAIGRAFNEEFIAVIEKTTVAVTRFGNALIRTINGAGTLSQVISSVISGDEAGLEKAVSDRAARLEKQAKDEEEILGRRRAAALAASKVDEAYTGDTALKPEKLKLYMDGKNKILKDANDLTKKLRDQDLDNQKKYFDDMAALFNKNLDTERKYQDDLRAVKRGYEDLNASNPALAAVGIALPTDDFYKAKRDRERSNQDYLQSISRKNQDAELDYFKSVEDLKFDATKARYAREDALAKDAETRRKNEAAGGSTPASATSLSDMGKIAQSMGGTVSEFKAWGQRVGLHSAHSQHYSGNAMDINTPGPGNNTPAEYGKLVPILNKAIADGFYAIIEDRGTGNQHLHIQDTSRNISGGSAPIGSGAFAGGPVQTAAPNAARAVDQTGLITAQNAADYKVLLFKIRQIEDDNTKAILTDRRTQAAADVELAKTRQKNAYDWQALDAVEQTQKKIDLEASKAQSAVEIRLYDLKITALQAQIAVEKDILKLRGEQALLAELQEKRSASLAATANEQAVIEGRRTSQQQEALALQNRFDDSLASTRNNIEQANGVLTVQTSNYGLMDDALAPLLIQKQRDIELQQQINDAAAKGISFSQGQIDAYNQETQSLSNLAVRQQEFTQEHDRLLTLSQDISGSFGGLFRDLVSGGKSAQEALSGFFGHIADAFLNMAEKMLTDALTKQLFGMLGGLGGSGGGGGLGGGGFDFSGAASGLGGSLVAGIGGGGLSLFAGGGVTNRPAIFGDSGAEAAVPLPDGRSIPVSLSGSSGTTVIVNQTVNVQGSNASKQDISDAAKQGMLTALMDSRINEQLRPGGSIARATGR